MLSCQHQKSAVQRSFPVGTNLIKIHSSGLSSLCHMPKTVLHWMKIWEPPPKRHAWSFSLSEHHHRP